MNSGFDDELEVIKRKKFADLQRRFVAKAAMSSLAEPIMITDSSFSNEIAKYPVVLVDFWAPWCGPCRMTSPIIEQLARDYSGKAVFGKVNVDENQVTAASLGIRSIPTFIIFKDGRAADVITGAVPKATIETKLEQYLGS